jgi:hypothetical protein
MVEGDRHFGAAGVLHRRDGRAVEGVSVGVAVGVPQAGAPTATIRVAALVTERSGRC